MIDSSKHATHSPRCGRYHLTVYQLLSHVIYRKAKSSGDFFGSDLKITRNYSKYVPYLKALIPTISKISFLMKSDI